MKQEDLLKQKLTIVKVGGEIVENPEALMLFLEKIILLESRRLILVHGGGRDADELQKKLNIPIKKFEGKRITDPNTLEVIIMCYSGINKKIVAKLQALDTLPIGLCGADLNCIRSKKRPVKDIDYGFVGDIEYVCGGRLKDLIEAGFLPVVSPITHDGEGQLLNTNADTVASEVAMAMSEFFEVELIYCFGKKGVLLDENDDESVIHLLTKSEFEKLKAEGTVDEGMIPKLENAFKAFEFGVKVIITHAEYLNNPKAGTLIV